MSSVAAIIKVADSLIPLPPEAFPKNLSRTVREDSPESMFPILAYDGQNILPTPWGYRSYFATNEKLLQASVARLLTNVKCENIFWYQSVNLDNVLVALASDGIYITNTDIDTAWIKVVDLAAFDTDPLVRNQWTFCTINNYTYIYMQGIDAFYGLVDPARYAEAATPSVITDATVTQVAEHWNVGVIKYIPNFLNMSGQIGIFKAGNRLGFWDSDGSVSWSSALFVEDMKPSVTTLAGFSKFVDVIGTITKIVQHGDGFIIYCTRSIVGVSNNVNEKSKFSGRSILSTTGVLTDRQIVVAQPDSVHYALTSSGLYTIRNYAPEVLATDIIDGLVEYNNYLSLDYIDGRYLFINTINGWQGSVLEFAGTTHSDFDGNEFVFPDVEYPNPEDAKALLENYIEGKNQLIQAAFDDYEPLDDPVHVVPEGKPLLPCYDIRPFDSSWVGETFTAVEDGDVDVESKISSGHVYVSNNSFIKALFTTPSYSLKSTEFDQAEEDAATVIQDTLTDIKEHFDYQSAWYDALLTSSKFINIPKQTQIGGPLDIVEAYTDEEVDTISYNNHINFNNFKVVVNECRTHLFIDRYSRLDVRAKFTGVEEYRAAVCTIFLNGWAELTWYYPIPALLLEDFDKIALFAMMDQERLDEFKILFEAQISSGFDPDVFTLTGMASKDTNNTVFPASEQLQVKRAYVLWRILANDEDVVAFAPDGTVLEHDIILALKSWLTAMRLSDTVLVFTPAGYPEISLLAEIHTTLFSQNEVFSRVYFNGNYYSSQTTVWHVRSVTSGGNRTWTTTLINCSDLEVISAAQVRLSNFVTEAVLVTDGFGKTSLTDPEIIDGTFAVGSPTDDDNIAKRNAMTGDEWLSGSGYVKENESRTNVNWDAALKSAWYTDNGHPTSTISLQRLVGTITYEYDLVSEDAETIIDLLDMEISGWGYVPSGGFSFRKTHARHSSTECPLPGPAWSVSSIPEEINPSFSDYDINSNTVPPYQWEYPSTIPLPVNYWLTQVGSAAPLYPLFTKSLIYDTQLEKWGISNMSFKAICAMAPVNRTDKTIAPKHDYGMIAAVLNEDGSVSTILPKNTESEICYGKIGQYRLGKSTLSYLKCHFKEPFTGSIIVETSKDGRTVAIELTKAADFTNVKSAKFPFTLVGDWFNIKVRGDFTLSHIECYIEGRSRR